MHPGALLAILLSAAAAAGAWCWLLYEREGDERERRNAEQRQAAMLTAKDQEREALLSQLKKEKLAEVDKLQSENSDLRRQLADAIEAAKPPPTAAEVAERVRSVRELAFTRVLEFVALPSEQILQRLADAAVAGVTPEMAEARVRAARAMGFVDQDFDYRAAVVNLAQAKPGGFHDAAAGRLYYQLDSPLARADARELFASAVLPVLIGQNFPAPAGEPDNDDALLAAQSLARGDASAARVKFSLSDQARTNFDKGQAPAPPPQPAGPQFMVELWKWSEDAGNLFVQELLQKGGMPAVNAAHARPPRSSAEILHPADLYLAATPFEPVKVRFPDATVNGVAPLFNNVAGEVLSYFLIRKTHPVDEARAAAAGWAGDRYLVWPGDKARGDHVFWRTEWSTEKDAREFFAAMRTGLMSRHLIPWQQEYDAVPQQFRVDDPHRSIRLRHSGKTVTLLDATDAAFAKAAEEKFVAPGP